MKVDIVYAQALELDSKQPPSDREANGSLYFVELWDIGEALLGRTPRVNMSSRISPPPHVLVSSRCALTALVALQNSSQPMSMLCAQEPTSGTRTCGSCSTAASTASSLCRTPLPTQPGTWAKAIFLACAVGAAPPVRTQSLQAPAQKALQTLYHAIQPI